MMGSSLSWHRGGADDYFDLTTDDSNRMVIGRGMGSSREGSSSSQGQALRARNDDNHVLPRSLSRGEDFEGGEAEGEESVEEFNGKIADMLEETSKKYFSSIRRRNAFAGAAAAIRAYPRRIQTFEQAIAVRGIGKKIACDIVSFLNTGHSRLSGLRNDSKTTIMELFQSIHDIGPNKAEILYKEGFRTLDTIKGHRVLTPAANVCLALRDELSERIPRAEALSYLREAKKCIADLSSNLRVELCGSISRGKSDSRDIDLMFYDVSLRDGENIKWLKPIVMALMEKGMLTHVLSGPCAVSGNEDDDDDKNGNDSDDDRVDRGVKKMRERNCSKKEVRNGRCRDDREKSLKKARFSNKPQIYPGISYGECALAVGFLPKSSGGTGLHRRVDVRVCHRASLPFQRIHFQSGREFNRCLRNHANSLGYSLSENGLVRINDKKIAIGKPIKCKTEEEIFAALGLPYYPPEKRNSVPQEMNYIRTGKMTLNGKQPKIGDCLHRSAIEKTTTTSSYSSISSKGSPRQFFKKKNLITKTHDNRNNTGARNHRRVKYYLVMDIEATCEEGSNFVGMEQEIIEMSFVLLNAQTLNIDDTLQVYVRPTENPTLSLFCRKLTGINQAHVEQAPILLDALPQIDEWLQLHSLLPCSGLQTLSENSSWPYKFALVTDGGRDPVSFVAIECKRKGVPMPSYYKRWVNLEYHFCKTFNVEFANMDGMLKHFNLQFEGAKHSGITDARNLARCTIEIIRHVISGRGSSTTQWPLTLNDGVGRGRFAKKNSTIFVLAQTQEWTQVFLELQRIRSNQTMLN